MKKFSLIIMASLILTASAFAEVSQPLQCANNVDPSGNLCTSFTFGAFISSDTESVVTQDGVPVTSGYYQASYGNLVLPNNPADPTNSDGLSLTGCVKSDYSTTRTRLSTTYDTSTTLTCPDPSNTGTWTGTIAEHWVAVRTFSCGGKAHLICYVYRLDNSSGELSLYW